MEKIEEKLNNEPDFESLRQKVDEIKKREMTKKEMRESYDSHFDKIISEALLEKDLLIFKDFMEDNLTMEVFNEYQREFDELSHKEAQSQPRSAFRGWIANQLMGRVYKEKESV